MAKVSRKTAKAEEALKQLEKAWEARLDAQKKYVSANISLTRARLHDGNENVSAVLGNLMAMGPTEPSCW